MVLLAKKGPKSKKGSGKRRGGNSILDRIKRMSIGDVGSTAFGAFSAVGTYTGFNSEVKAIETSGTTTAVAAGTITPLSLIAQGSNYNNRDGDSIRAHGLEFRYQIANYVGGRNVGRLILFQDSECRGSVPAVADLMSTSTGNYAPLSPWNYFGGPRFNILWDSGPIMVDGVTGGPSIWASTVEVPLKNHIEYVGTAGTITEQFENGLFVFMCSADAANGPTVVFTSRLHYIDN